MFYSNNLADIRQMYFASWKNYLQNKPLLPLEQQIVEVILAHPEYQAMLDTTSDPNQTYPAESGQSNPFLHMGLHLAIRDQVATNRPQGISHIYRKLLQKYGDQLTTEHVIMDYLAECLWYAQRQHRAPDEQQYLQALRQLC